MLNFEFFPIPMLVGLGVLLFLMPVVWRKKHNLRYLFFFSVFWTYMLVVAGLTLFPIPSPFTGETRQSAVHIFSEINLVPFFIRRALRLRFLLRTDLGSNILLTIPYGFLLPLILRFQPRHFIWYALGIGLLIELAQLAGSLVIGVAYRVVDINDVLMNAIGALIGYALYRLVTWGKGIHPPEP